jgi:uncharacterized protein YwqG
LERNCVIFVPGAIEEGDAAPIGGSRLGGQPDLPPDVDWPIRPPLNVEDTLPGLSEDFRKALKDVRNRAWPLSFVAQIDFAEVHLVRALDDFPPTGRLLFF